MSGCSDAALWPSRRGLRAARLSPGAPREEGEEFLRLPLAIFSIELGQGRCSPRLSGRDGLQTLQMCSKLRGGSDALPRDSPHTLDFHSCSSGESIVGKCNGKSFIRAITPPQSRHLDQPRTSL